MQVGEAQSDLTPITIADIEQENERRRSLTTPQDFISNLRDGFQRQLELFRPIVAREEDMTPPFHFANPNRMRSLLRSPMDKPALMRAIREFNQQTYRSFYGGGEKFSANETIRGLVKIGEQSTYGNAYIATDRLYVLKQSKNPNSALTHEAFVGRVLSELRDRTPIFASTLGTVNCSNDEFSESDEVWCSTGENMTHLVVYEYVEGVPAYRFTNRQDLLSYFSIYALLLHGLQLAFDEYQFTHNDLHSANVMIEDIGEQMFFQLDDDLFLLSQYIPRVLDYGFSRITYQGTNYVRLYSSNRPNIILDAFNFLMSDFFKSHNLPLYRQFLDQLCGMFTPSSDYFDTKQTLRTRGLRPVFRDTINQGVGVRGIIQMMASSLPEIFFTREQMLQLQRENPGLAPLYQCGNENRPACINVDSIPVRDTVVVRNKPRVVSSIHQYTQYANWYLNNYVSLTEEENDEEIQLMREYATMYEDNDMLRILDEIEDS